MDKSGEIVNYAPENVRELRRQSGLSRQAVVDRLGEWGVSLHPTSLRRIEEGQQAVKIEEAQAFAYIFGLSLTDLISHPVNPGIARSQQAVAKYREALRAVSDGTAAAAAAWAGVREATAPEELPRPIRGADSIQAAMRLLGNSIPVLQQMRELNQSLVELGVPDGWRDVPQSALEAIDNPFIKSLRSRGAEKAENGNGER